MEYRFVRCKTSPDSPLQYWGSGSAIYSKCSCGTECSYEKSNAFEYNREHYTFFKIVMQGRYFTEETCNTAENLILKNEQKYTYE